ncbi:MAG: helix-turn-helix domain-containing protein [Alistipes sp.]|nr:helix-turn-helix domain-containing protein [Alistipes sp.]
MNAKGKIGVIIPEIFDPLDFELLRGIDEIARAYGFDVIVFTGIRNSVTGMEFSSYTRGLENIYNLVGMTDLDGIIFAAEKFHSRTVEKKIYDTLRGCKAKCIVLGQEQKDFRYIISEQTKIMRHLTEHLIREHNCESLYFLAGVAGECNSELRYKGFCEALDEVDMFLDDSCLFYGDYWTEKPKKLAADIASGVVVKPDGIVCANDMMAITLCSELNRLGVKVPDDIAVVGFDGSWFAFSNNPSITTAEGRERQLGENAAIEIIKAITGETLPASKTRQRIRFGRSCGCQPFNMDHNYIHAHTVRMYERYINRIEFYDTDMIERFQNSETSEELFSRIGEVAYILQGWESLNICLCEDWRFSFNNYREFRINGFSEKMILALSKQNGELVHGNNIFPTPKILPSLEAPHEPELTVLTSLHGGDQIFGYFAIKYKTVDDICLDEHYINWCDAVSNGLRKLQEKQYRQYVNRQIEELSLIDPISGLLNKRGLLTELSDSFSKHENSLIMLISFEHSSTADKKDGIDTAMLIANALRLSSETGELYAKLGNSVFAAFIRKNISPEEKMLNIEKKLSEMQGTNLSSHRPELAFSYFDATSIETSRLSAIIDEEQKKLEAKIKIMTETIADYKHILHMLRRDIYIAPQDEWNIDLIAREYSISRSHLQRLYKTYFLVSIHDDIINARLEKAKELLRHSDLRIHEVALMCGYHNASHFMRQFKNHTGETAKEYRIKQNGE